MIIGATGNGSPLKQELIKAIKLLSSENDTKAGLLLLREECVKNPEIHPNCIGIVDRATAEIERLEKEYAKDTVHFHNKWMEAEEKLRQIKMIAKSTWQNDGYRFGEILKIIRGDE